MAFFYLKSQYALCFLFIMLFFRPKMALPIWFLAAIFWSMLHQWLIADSGMPNTPLIKQAVLQGYITSIPARSPNKTQFQFLIEQLNDERISATVLLSCYEHCPDLRAGQYWQLQAKLKKPINLANPGGFDYVSWLSTRHIQWVGNVRNTSFKQIPSKTTSYSLIMLREKLSDILAKIDPDEETLGVFESLTIGLTNHVKKPQWDLFRQTGTTHLIDISGEHIAIVAGCSFWLLKWLWKHMGQLCLKYPAPKIASVGAMLITYGYSLVAGFAVPTQRALITSFFMLSCHVFNQRFSIWQAWRYALFAVLLFEPHSVLMLGFYFSFIAVAILILINQRLKYKGIRKMMTMQLACLFGLMPLTLYWFSYGSLNGFLANLIAIPWVGFVIVPFALIIALLSPWVVIPYSVVVLKWSIHFLLVYLTFIDSYAKYNISYTFVDAFSPLALMLVMALFAFLPVMRLFPAAAVLGIASFFPQYEKITPGDARIDVLDVGQGLAIVVSTAQHVLVYDTGMKFYQGGDMGKLAIIPYLRTLGLKQLDKVIISHPDLDHRGGLESLEQNYKIKELIVDDPVFYKRGVSCHTHASWQWDGVSFRFFPISTLMKSKNNNSCILQIANRAGKVLFSGDIERPAEQYLVTKYAKDLASTIMLIPHHGSKTSSSASFIEQIAPKYAVVSYGFDNRYHFPHQKAMQVYHEHQIPVFNTLDCGMVSIHLQPEHMTPRCYRANDYLQATTSKNK
ncbi:MAG: DNA internalization-related competence protein ComEC/Rec2 [Legionellaceae bacterium]|nr:DNA internalization-related competence protein ComEC/Rec2 [Legionellaceae bacterium]